VIPSHRLWLGILALIPFAYSADIYEGALLPKLLILQLGLTVIAATLIRSRQQIPQRLTLLTTLHLSAIMLSILQATNKTESWAHFSQYAALAMIPGLVAVTLGARELLVLFRALTLVSIPVSIIGVSQYLGIAFLDLPSQANPSATFFHRNAAAGYVVATLPLAALSVWSSRQDRLHSLYSIACGLLLVFLVFTRTRGAWVGTVVATLILVILGWFASPSETALRPRGHIPYLAGALLIILAAGLIPEHAPVGERPEFDDKKPSAIGAVASIVSPGGHRGRPELWRNTLTLIADNPILGVGIGNWEFNYPSYAAGDHVNIDAAPRRPHNDLLWVASETGLIGLVAFLALIGFSLLNGIRALGRSGAHRNITFACLFVVIAHLTDGLFNFPRERIGGASLFWVAIGGLWVVNPPKGNARVPTWILVAAIAFLAWGTHLTLRRMAYDYHHIRVHAAERAQDWDGVLEHGNKALGYGSFRANTWIALGRAYYRSGETDLAINAHASALRLHPNSLNAHNNLGIAYRRAGRIDEAIRSLEQAILLYPNFVQARNNLGNALRDKGEYDASIRVLEEAAKRGGRIAQVYVNLARSYQAKGDENKARMHYMNALKIDPKNAAARDALRKYQPRPEAPSVDRS